jgi:hypothetical protein
MLEAVEKLIQQDSDENKVENESSNLKRLEKLGLNNILLDITIDSTNHQITTQCQDL